MKRILLTFICILSVALLLAQNCLEVATAQSPGLCDDQAIPCDNKNFTVDPDLITPLYDYKVFSLPGYAVSQKFGSLSNNSEDFDSLDVSILMPVNNKLERPVVIFSPLSSFTHSNISSYLAQYLGNYFASRGYLFISFESRRFVVHRVDMNNNSELTDYISNAHYTSDTNVMAHFREFRDNSTANYGFFSLIAGLNEASESDQLMTDAYYEMMYKNMHDVKYLLSRLYDDRFIFRADMDNIFLMGGSAGAVQSMNAALLSDPDEIDQEFTEEMMEYKGMNFPAVSRLRDDFVYENEIVNNIKPKGVVNLWGRLTSLDIIDGNDPSILSVHGTWDEIFPFQNQRSSILPDVIGGFGAEGIFLKSRSAGIGSGIISVCQGGHTLFPQIALNCSFPLTDEKVFFDSLLFKINNFIRDTYANEEKGIIETMSHPIQFNEPKNFTLIPSSASEVSDSNAICPKNYPDEFNLGLYEVSTGFDEPHLETNESNLNFQLYSHANLKPAFVSFDLERSELIKLRVNDMSGKTVYQMEQLLPSGPHILPLDWKDQPIGMYQFTLYAGNKFEVRQMLVID